MSDKASVAGKSETAKYRVHIAAGNNEVIADEPVEKGGGDTGFTPYQLLLSSLAACTAITVRMYAERKGWDTGEIDVEIAMETEKGDTMITRKLTFAKPLGAAEHERLIAVANACPVHKILTGKIAVATS
jgi:putative redox protein